MTAFLFFIANIAVSAGTWLAIREFRRILAEKADAGDQNDQNIKLNSWCRRLSAELAKIQRRVGRQNQVIDSINTAYRRLAERILARNQGETDFDYERRIDKELGI